ncbi:enoyl-CoA hydratase/isomerase family protein [Yinghuangia sp. ASG 101]|uniref:enoyl-CoA hydratase/isomerase family protein n=1 Tax=Yinghuangia sp. ASG 101 TaxID=2896848 RepID=UPI001E2870DC|nr:enoyl-CoA hydratase/isomerase family protein [Yinghuangia sp. ASG 101]UGQ15059.1 enoyl-CoA hydratase/isomerase family protein [Yinghuangia sp. ASG 101]
MSGLPSNVVARVEHGIGRITLDRPRAINALSHPMVRAMDRALAAWADDDAVRAVVVDGAGERGLCAGGDIRAFRDDALGDGTATPVFWVDEYRLNARIARYPKPYVALMDGIVMGGGVGISAHGSVRVVTERTRLGMPEVGIGLVPDVGGSRLLGRAPGLLGTHIALTAYAMDAGDAIHCGFADHFVPSDRLPDLLRACADGDVSAAVRAHAEAAPPSRLAEDAAWVDACYAAPTVEEVLVRLRDAGEAASSAAKEIEGNSPTCVKVAFRALPSAAELPTLEDALEQEYRISTACLRTADLIEGIRARIVDKDRDPKWSPATLAEVGDEAVDRFFAPADRRVFG